MAITKKAMRKAKSELMAAVLNEVACDLRNPLECRTQLGFAGFTDQQIDNYLADAQLLARRLRRDEIDKLAKHQWDLKTDADRDPDTA